MRRAYFAALISILSTSNVWSQDHLTIVSPHWEGVRYEFESAFSRKYQEQTGRKVEITWLDVGATYEIVRYIASEFKRSPNGINVDLVFGGGADPYISFKNAGYLQPIRIAPEIMDGVAGEIGGAKIHDSNGEYFSPIVSVFGIMCNREVLRRIGLPEPQTWEDLLDPRFHGWLGSGDPRRSGSVHSAYEVLLQTYGWQKGWQTIMGMAHNTRAFVASASQSAKDVAFGEVACALAIDSVAANQINELGPHRISFVVPHSLGVVNGDGVAVLRGAPNLNAAQAFIEFLLSEDGQRIWLDQVGIPGGPQRYRIGRLAIMPKLYQRSPLPSSTTIDPFKLGKLLNYDSDKGARRWNVLNDLFGTLVIEAHREIVNQPQDDTQFPVTEEEIDAIIASGDWDHAIKRAEKIRSWKSITPTKYDYTSSALPLILVVISLLVVALRKRLSNRAS